MHKTMFSWEKKVIKISKRFISTLVGVFAISLFIVSFAFVLISLTFHTYIPCPIVFVLMATYPAARDWYIECRKKEIDDELGVDNNED